MASQWKPLLICSDQKVFADAKALLSKSLPGCPLYDLQSYPAKYTLADVINRQKPNVCFLDVASDRDRSIQIIGEIGSIDPNLSVIALDNRNDPEMLLACMRSGASGILISPLSGEQLAPILDRIAKQNPALRSSTNQGKVYVVMPAKGACGASTIASTLAYQWKRHGAKRALLADLDPLTGTLSFLLKVKSEYSFLDVLSRTGNLDADLWKGMVTPIHGVDVLLAPEQLVNGVSELHDSGSVMQFARELYDAVTIDCSGAYGEWSLNMARHCDELLLVTTNELPALQATQRTLSYLDHHRVDRNKIRLVVNRYNRDVGLSKEVIGTALHTEVFHLIPSDYDAVNRALMEGKPIPTSTSFGKSVSQLADRLVELNPIIKTPTDVPSPPPKKTGFSLFGLFGKG